MKNYGCIGKKLTHSFSKEIHARLADYQYDLIELTEEELPKFFEKKDFEAINVTIPYKQAVIPYLDEISDIAERIGAVNTVVNRSGRLFGYNTDYYGMKALIEHAGVNLQGKKVLILGTGGTGKTAQVLASDLGASEILAVSRRKIRDCIDYNEAVTLHTDAQIIINTTPVGMFPGCDATPIDLSTFDRLEGVIDAIYNPLQTNLVREAKNKGIKAEGGLYMLVMQAVVAVETFLDTKFESSVGDRVFASVLEEKTKKNSLIATFRPCRLQGTVSAPPSKSMAHRYLIGAAISGQTSKLTGMNYGEDILATIDCLKALGAKIIIDGDSVAVDPQGFMQAENPILDCRESGSTLRFLIPIALCLGRTVTFRGSERLFERPLAVYEELCCDNGFFYKKDDRTLTLCGNLKSGHYKLRGDVSSQFITGLLFALVYLKKDASVEILPPFESRSYIDLTVAALQAFGAHIAFTDEYNVEIKASALHSLSAEVEGDYSNAAFLDAFNRIGSEITIKNLNPDSLQGDRVYNEYFEQISKGTPTLDISDCPDLGPVLIALSALKNGATITGTDRLKAKESDRGAAMDEELKKLGGGLIFGDNTITIPKQELKYQESPLDGHNDHRIVMALSVILSKTGGSIEGAEAIKKSYPGFFEDIKQLGAEVILS